MRYILSALFTLPAHALTLREALRSAQQNSPTLQRSASQRRESAAKVRESSAQYYPKVSGAINYLPAHKYTLTDVQLPGSPTALSFPGIVPTTRYGLTAQYGLFDGLATTNHHRAVKALESASVHELDWTQFQVEREVILRFYRALVANSLKTVADANLKTLVGHLNEVQLLKKTGVSTTFDVLRVEVQVSDAQSEVLNATDNITTANAALAEVLGVENALAAEGELPLLKSEAVDALETNVALDRADLTALAGRVEALDYQSKAAASHWAPYVGLVANYQYYNNRNDRAEDWSAFRNAYEAGVNLTWNLFEGFGAEAKKREALEQRVQLDKTLRIAQLKAHQDSGLWKRKYKYFYSVFISRKNNIGKAQESVRLAREGRRAGARTNADLLDAETDLYRSQAGAINAQLGVIEALIELELSTGQKLYDFN